MTEPPLVVFAVPDRFEIDGAFVARVIEERDIPVVAPAFRDPGIGGENGMPPFDEDELRRVWREQIPKLRSNVRIGNDASERVLERAGFTREGVKRRLLRHGAGRADATLFSLLPDE